jgi:Mrp family chromosome partitioning ATPase
MLSRIVPDTLSSRTTLTLLTAGATLGAGALLIYQNLPPLSLPSLSPIFRRFRDIPEDAPDSCPGPQSTQAGKSDSCAGCPNQSACSSGTPAPVDPAIAAITAKLSTVKHKILVLSGKGGVGKSTTSAQLAFALARDPNTSVGLLDVDICGPSIPRMLGLHGREVHQTAQGWSPVYLTENLGVMSIGFLLPDQDAAIVWRGPKKHALIKQFLGDVDWGELDYLVVDTPPGTSDEHLSLLTYLGAAGIDGAVLVTTPQEVALQDVRKEINFCKQAGVRVLGVVENMAGLECGKCGELNEVFVPSTGGAEKMCENMGVKFLGRLGLMKEIALAGEFGVEVLKKVGESGVFEGVVRGVLDQLENTKGEQ